MLITVAGMVRAQGGRQEKTELLLHFRFDRSLVDSGYRNNAAALHALHECFADSLQRARIDSVSICSYSSPEGDAAYNQRLAVRRAKAVKGYLVWKYPQLDQYGIRTHSRVSGWQTLLAAVEQNPGVPCRQEVMNILSLKVSDAKKETLLKSLNGGEPYRYIFRHILPELRNAAICVVWMKQANPEYLVTKETQPVYRCHYRPDRQSVRVEQSPTPTFCRGGVLLRPDTPTGHTGTPKKQPLFALKTNLLFDLAMMPNVELEVPIRKRWSLNGEIMFPWWLFDGDKYCMQVLAGGLEGRYWLGNRERRKVLTGHFLGLYAGGGKYDLQWDTNGYQGEFFIAAGLSYGYAASIARNLRLEFNIGIGLLKTSYEHYHAIEDYKTLLWQNNGRYTWFGPTKAKISLVWLLGRKAKKGGVR